MSSGLLSSARGEKPKFPAPCFVRRRGGVADAGPHLCISRGVLLCPVCSSER